MLAVIETGGKQYVVKSGDLLAVERLPGEPGAEIVFDRVLLTAADDGTSVKMGNPFISGTTVKGVVETQGRTKKINVIKYKRKVRYRKLHGHRQYVTKVKIV